jgi:hypothetical protein
MPEFGIKECLCLVRGTLECFIKTLCERGQNLEENDSEGESIHVFDNRRQAEGPDVLRFRAKGMTRVSLLSGDRNRTQKDTYFDISSSTGFPVSKTVDKRLLANTSGEISTNM